jgi:predicted metal-dependent HD superfamily phosphohydrolase
METHDFPAPWTQGCDAQVMEAARHAYGSPGRHYHTWEHVIDCAGKLRDFPCADPRAVFLALLFHDAVYVAGDTRNERRSADLAREVLRAHSSVPAEEVAEIERFILATCTHVVAPDERSSDLRTVIDIDMSILGASEERYRRYAAAVMREWCPSVVDEDGFRRGRAAFLRGILASPKIFSTEEGGRRWEEPARANIERELAELG